MYEDVGGDAEELMRALEMTMLGSVASLLLSGRGASGVPQMLAECRRASERAVPQAQRVARKDAGDALRAEAALSALAVAGHPNAAAAAASALQAADSAADEVAQALSLELPGMARSMEASAPSLYYRCLYDAEARMKEGWGYEQTMAHEVRRMADEGLTAVTYERRDGTLVRVPVDVGVRRTIQTHMGDGLRDAALAVAAETYGLVEVSVTATCRESHEPWQGGVYSVPGRSVQGYRPFNEACHVGDPVEGFGGYNCYHRIRAYDPAIGKSFKDPLDGTGYTTDEARGAAAKQRQMERNVRRLKREKELLESQGLDAKEVKAKIRAEQARLRAHVSEHGEVLTRQPWREKVYAGGHGPAAIVQDALDGGNPAEALAEGRKGLFGALKDRARERKLEAVNRRAVSLGFKHAAFENMDPATAQEFLDETMRVIGKYGALRGRMMGFIGDMESHKRMAVDAYRGILGREAVGGRLSDDAVAEIARFERDISPNDRVFAHSLSLDLFGDEIAREFNGVSVNARCAQRPFELRYYLEEKVKSGFAPKGVKGNPIRFLASHEVAHQLDRLLGVSDSREFKALYDRYVSPQARGLSGHTVAEMRKVVDMQSLEKARHEFLADAMGEWLTCEKPGKHAQEVAELVNRMYNEAYG